MFSCFYVVKFLYCIYTNNWQHQWTSSIFILIHLLGFARSIPRWVTLCILLLSSHMRTFLFIWPGARLLKPEGGLTNFSPNFYIFWKINFSKISDCVSLLILWLLKLMNWIYIFSAHPSRGLCLWLWIYL